MRDEAQMMRGCVVTAPEKGGRGRGELRALSPRAGTSEGPKATRDHRGDEAGTGCVQPVFGSAVQKTGDGAVGRHFKRHGDGDKRAACRRSSSAAAGR